MTVIKPLGDTVMAAERAAAIEKVDAHFNRLALQSLHDDLVAVMLRKVDALRKRDGHKSELIRAIDEAKTPDEIKQAIATIFFTT